MPEVRPIIYFATGLLALSSFGHADALFEDPAPIPADLIQMLRHEGVPAAQQAMAAQQVEIDANSRAVGALVANDGFLRGNSATTARDLQALRTQLKELLAQQKRLADTRVSFRSNVDGKVHEQDMGEALAAPLAQRIADLKEILFGLERADISREQANQLYRGRVEQRGASRQVYYDPQRRLDVDLQPNWQPPPNVEAVEKQLAQQKADLEAGRVIHLQSPVSNLKSK